MKSLALFLSEARIDFSGINTQIIDDITNLESISAEDVNHLINELKKINYKPLQDFLEIIDILSLPANELKGFYIYGSDKSKIKQITKIDKAQSKLDSVLPSDYMWAIDKAITYLFRQKATKNKDKINYAADVINALRFGVGEYITDNAEEKDRASLGDFRGWYDKCRDLALAGSFAYTKLSSSYRDFHGLIDEYFKYINKYTSKLSHTQLQQVEFINALRNKDKEKIIDLINQDRLKAFDPYVIRYVDKSGFSYVLCVVMQLVIWAEIDKNVKPDVLTSLIPNQFIKYINKVLN